MAINPNANKQKTDNYMDFDIKKYMADFKFPGLDMQSIMSSQRKNIEALSDANRMAYDGLQAVVKRQVEIVQQTMDEVARAAHDINAGGDSKDKITQNVDMAKRAFETSLANARELVEMISKANSEAFELLNKRFSQNLEELRETYLKNIKNG